MNKSAAKNSRSFVINVSKLAERNISIITTEIVFLSEKNMQYIIYHANTEHAVMNHYGKANVQLLELYLECGSDPQAQVSTELSGSRQSSPLSFEYK